MRHESMSEVRATLRSMIGDEALRRHHRFIGTDDDSEAFKQDVDTRWKRIALSTLPGFIARAAAPLKVETALSRLFALAVLIALVVCETAEIATSSTTSSIRPHFTAWGGPWTCSVRFCCVQG
jgi:hypothetical protein